VEIELSVESATTTQCAPAHLDTEETLSSDVLLYHQLCVQYQRILATRLLAETMLSVTKVPVPVYLNTLATLTSTVDLSVSLTMNADGTELVSDKNVWIPALAPVVSVLYVTWLTIHPCVHVQMDILGIHLNNVLSYPSYQFDQW
jgi:hypothetical protein